MLTSGAGLDALVPEAVVTDATPRLFAEPCESFRCQGNVIATQSQNGYP
jgi:hypothetical protein